MNLKLGFFFVAEISPSFKLYLECSFFLPWFLFWCGLVMKWETDIRHRVCIKITCRFSWVYDGSAFLAWGATCHVLEGQGSIIVANSASPGTHSQRLTPPWESPPFYPFLHLSSVIATTALRLLPPSMLPQLCVQLSVSTPHLHPSHTRVLCLLSSLLMAQMSRTPRNPKFNKSP